MIYSNIAIVYQYMGDHVNALLFYQKALEVQEKSLPPNHPNLEQTYY